MLLDNVAKRKVSLNFLFTCEASWVTAPEQAAAFPADLGSDLQEQVSEPVGESVAVQEQAAEAVPATCRVRRFDFSASC